MTYKDLDHDGLTCLSKVKDADQNAFPAADVIKSRETWEKAGLNEIPDPRYYDKEEDKDKEKYKKKRQLWENVKRMCSRMTFCTYHCG